MHRKQYNATRMAGRKHQNILAGLLTLIMGTCFCLLSSPYALVYADDGNGSGGSGSSSGNNGTSPNSPGITITEDTHQGNLATAELAKDGSISKVEFSYTIIPNGNVGTYEVYIGTGSSILTGEHYDEDDNPDAKIKSMPSNFGNSTNPELGNKEWGYRTSNLVTYAINTPTDNIPTATIDSNGNNDAFYKAMPIIDNATKNYGDQMYESGTGNLPTGDGRISGKKASKLAIEVAAKGDPTLPADKYRGTITLSVVATPKAAAKGFFEIETMQEMTEEVCSSATIPSKTATNYDTTGDYDGEESYIPETHLIDNRENPDGSKYSYIIRKLADGNCWMTQNLALQGRTSGNFVIDAYDFENDEIVPYPMPNSTYAFTGGIRMQNGNHIDNSQDDTTNNTGAYYSWLTAVAQTGDFSSETNITTSICPKGWRLPVGHSISSDNDKSFTFLYNSYGNFNYFNIAWQGGTVDNSNKQVLVGYMSSGRITNEDIVYWWSSTSGTNNSQGYFMNESATSVVPSYSVDRKFGFSVRCVFAK